MSSQSNPPNMADTPTRLTIPVGQWGRIWLRFGISTAFGVALILLVMNSSSPELTSYDTDIIGYPSFKGFDVGWYDRNYLLWIAAFPIVVLISYVVLGRCGRLGRWFVAPDGATLSVELAPAPLQLSDGVAGGVIRVLLLSVLFAALSSLSGRLGVHELFVVPAVGLSCVAVLGIAAYVLHGRGRTWAQALAIPVAVGSPLTLVVLWWTSSEAEVVLVNGVHVPYPFIPWWVVVLAVVPLLLVVFLRLKTDGVVDLARRIVVFLVVPVMIFVLRSAIPGTIGLPDVFHHGEAMVGADLFRSGLMPWRDFTAIHGLLQDSFQGALSFDLFERSWWGFSAGQSAIFAPLILVTMYILLAVLFERSWAYLTMCVIVLLSSTTILGGFIENAVSVWTMRFMFAPLVIAAFVLLVRKPTWVRSIGFTTLLFGQFVVTPESAFFIPAFAAALAVFEFIERDGSKRLIEAMPRIRQCLIVGGVLGFAFVALLVATGSLDDYILYFQTFAQGHALTGGLPVQWNGSVPFVLAVVLIPAAVLTVFGYVVWRIRSHRRLHSEDWALVALAAVVAAYYTKFLSRADGHIYQVLTLALPLFFAIAHRVIGFTRLIGGRDNGSARTLIGRLDAMVVVPLTLILLWPVGPSLLDMSDQFRSLSSRYHPEGVALPVETRLGYVGGGGFLETLLPELRSAFSDLPDDATVFDFTNQPLLYHFLLDEAPPTRYFHVSMAIREDTQHDLIKQLEQAPPTVVVMYGAHGFPGWDYVQNTVRHYDVSEWILARYHPWVRIQGELLYLRNDVVEPDGFFGDATPVDDLYFGIPACSWGRAAEHLTSSPTDRQLTDRTQLPVVSVTGKMHASGWAVDADRNIAAEFVVAVADGQVIAATDVAGSRPDLGEAFGFDPDAAAGFDIQIPLVGAPDEMSRGVSLVALFADGSARLIAGSPSSELPESLDFVGTLRSVEDGEVGHVERSVITPAVDGVIEFGEPAAALHLSRIELPNAHTNWNWLLFRSPDGLSNGVYSLSDQPNNSSHQIDATVASGSSRLALQVGSCPQWLGAQTDYLYISTPIETALIVEVARAPL